MIGVRPGPPHPERSILKDQAKEALLREQGYVVIDLPTSVDVESIRSQVLDTYRGERAGQHYTLLSNDLDYRNAVFDLGMTALVDVTQAVFDEYKCIGAALAFKWPGVDAVLGAHQDISIVDETRFRSYNLWIPMSDTTPVNGGLKFLPRSHCFLDNLRVMPRKPDWFDLDVDRVSLDDMTAVDVALGQAVVFDMAALHGSGPNLSGEVRAALSITHIPVEAQLLHFYLSRPDEEIVDVHFADETFYRRQIVGDRPDRIPEMRVPFYGTPRDIASILGMSRGIDRLPD